jgi:CRISPR/Cas system CSM-associated protein Csm3 (group 7 of RAMP superfamily)
VVAVPANHLSFEVTFHGPVRVGRGRAGVGVDDTVDPHVIVPGSSLKGLMRAEAATLLGDRKHRTLKRVFGEPRQPSPWHWSDVRAPQNDVGAVARIRVDSPSGSAVDSGLFTVECHWPRTAQFAVRRVAELSDDEEADRHEVLLWAAAMSVHSVGGDRNRGYGWVDVARSDAEPDDAFLTRLTELLGVSR